MDLDFKITTLFIHVIFVILQSCINRKSQDGRFIENNKIIKCGRLAVVEILNEGNSQIILINANNYGRVEKAS